MGKQVVKCFEHTRYVIASSEAGVTVRVYARKKKGGWVQHKDEGLSIDWEAMPWFAEKLAAAVAKKPKGGGDQ